MTTPNEVRAERDAAHEQIARMNVEMLAVEAERDRYRATLEAIERATTLGGTESGWSAWGVRDVQRMCRAAFAMSGSNGIDLPPDSNEGRRLADDLPGSY